MIRHCIWKIQVTGIMYETAENKGELRELVGALPLHNVCSTEYETNNYTDIRYKQLFWYSIMANYIV